VHKLQITGICQDLPQLKALYKERWESFLANAGVVQGFTPNDLTMADLDAARRAGQLSTFLRWQAIAELTCDDAHPTPAVVRIHQANSSTWTM
jgi:hypothetical protein